MSNVHYMNVSVQTFWSKYRVIISGLLSAIFTAIAPFVVGNSHNWDYKALLAAAFLAVSSFMARDQRGKTWTMIGQGFAGLATYASLYEGGFDVVRLVFVVAIAAFAIPIPPSKPSTYEHAPTIVQAKEEAKEISIIRKENNEKDKATN